MVIFGARFNGISNTLVIVFTIVEVLTLTFWLQTFLAGHFVLSAGILAGGLLIEHTISAATGVHVTKA